MDTVNRWHRGKYEATAAPCGFVAVYPAQAADGPPTQIALSDGSPLERIAKGRYQTREGIIVVSTEPDAP
jgi:hypothetical protein